MADTGDLQVISDALAENETTAREVAGGLTQTQLEWQPAGGWSILQCIEHLTLSNRVYSEAIKGCLDRATGRRGGSGVPSGIRPSAPGRFFLRQLEPPVTRKVSAPRRIVPASVRARDEVLNAFNQSHDEIRKLLHAASGLDLNTIKFRNPLLPLLRVRVGTGLLIMPAHERRHLWQARQVKAAILKTS